ncbi:hypothetical protein ACLM5J_14630 [Nocardioides sp. Bht2]|uniref:hypothetical protein n=1 Tax=Nocardioides sp. Bht2 TaxID=3392297 RepID=UPI0039B61064
MNLCFDAVDLRVVHGSATAAAVAGVQELDYANLLEQVGAVAGLFHGLGTENETVLGVAVADPFIELLTLLAGARLGATVVSLDDVARLEAYRPTLVVSDALLDFAGHEPRATVLIGVEPADPQRDITWEMGLRAGRTKPAGAAVVRGDQLAYVLDGEVTVAEAADDQSRYGAWLRLLRSGQPIELGTSA